MGDLYRYTDKAGVEHLVEKLGDVPQVYRSKAKLVETQVQVEETSAVDSAGQTAATHALRGVRSAEEMLHTVGWTGRLHAPSFAPGAGVVVAAVLVVSLLRTRQKRVWKFVGLAVWMATLAVGYGSWLRFAVGISSGSAPAIVTPKALVDDARKAAAASEAKAAEQERALEAIAE